MFERKKNKISTTYDLADLIKKTKPHKKPYRIHPATKTFQALRIFINNELEELKNFINDSLSLLAPGSRLVLITFHSLEDRLVKNFIKKGKFEGELEKDFFGNPQLKFKAVNRKPILPAEEEIKNNNRARSAKLRIAEKV